MSGAPFLPGPFPSSVRLPPGWPPPSSASSSRPTTASRSCGAASTAAWPSPSRTSRSSSSTTPRATAPSPLVEAYEDPRLRVVAHDQTRASTRPATPARSRRGGSGWSSSTATGSCCRTRWSGCGRRSTALPEGVRVVRFRLLWDDGSVTPTFVPPGPFGYEGRIRWAEEEGGNDAGRCIQAARLRSHPLHRRPPRRDGDAVRARPRQGRDDALPRRGAGQGAQRRAEQLAAQRQGLRTAARACGRRRRTCSGWRRRPWPATARRCAALGATTVRRRAAGRCDPGLPPRPPPRGHPPRPAGAARPAAGAARLGRPLLGLLGPGGDRPRHPGPASPAGATRLIAPL